MLIKKIEAKKLPEVDDDFAKEATEFETAEELMADTRNRIEEMKKSQSSMLVTDKTGEALAELVTEDIPEALIEDQMQRQLQDMAMRLAQQGIQLEQFLEMTGQDIDALRENMREPAEQAARVDLALRAVVAAEGLELSDDAVQAEIDDTAAQLGQTGEELREAFESGGQLNALRADLLKQRAMDMLLESVEIVDEDGKAIDRADLEPPDEADDDEGKDVAVDSGADEVTAIGDEMSDTDARGEGEPDASSTTEVEDGAEPGGNTAADDDVVEADQTTDPGQGADT
ncbi:MAG: hypothetical protein ACR2N9_11010 [Acidimicrobiia bacterium]